MARQAEISMRQLRSLVSNEVPDRVLVAGISLTGEQYARIFNCFTGGSQLRIQRLRRQRVAVQATNAEQLGWTVFEADGSFDAPGEAVPRTWLMRP